MTKDSDDQEATSSAIDELTAKVENISLSNTEYTLTTTLQYYAGETLTFSEQETIPLPTPIVVFQPLFDSIKEHFAESSVHSKDWEVSQSKVMSMPIRDVTKLIPEYDGKEKAMNSFIKKIDKLWLSIAALNDQEKGQFLLVLQIKLTDKAAEAVQDNAFANWEAVKADLIEHITPHRNTEKSELKLYVIKQNSDEDVETYAKRIEDALDTLNRSFAQEDQNETIRRENGLLQSC